MLDFYMHRPYVAVLERNSAEVKKTVLEESQQIIGGVLIPYLRVVTFGITALFTMAFLFLYNPALALLAGAVLGGGYGVVFLLVRRGLSRHGRRLMEANRLRFKTVDEALASIKETKVLGREAAFVTQFGTPARQWARALSLVRLFTEIPRYAMETLAFGSVLVMVLYLISTEGDTESVIPVLGVYTFAGYRMLPALNAIYVSLSQARFNRVVLDALYQDIRLQGELRPTASSEKTRGSAGRRLLYPSSQSDAVGITDSPTGQPSALQLRHSLELRDVSFTYPGASSPAVHGISLTIPRGAFVGFVGQTGSGKTTLVDIVLGLLTPDSGSLLVDGKEITENDVRAWQDNLGYVPQDIYLTDDSIEANIALGVPAGERDMVAIEHAARIAKIHDFVVDRLPKGYETTVGERGVRLSGGQRQRIGIARAIYHDPDLIVLDEATSNLDQSTEATIYDAIGQVAGEKTVIVVAHRLSMAKHCSALFLLSQGRIVGEGNYEELLETSPDFRAMVNA
jgi:ATP-binding cassette subfamily C protein